MNIKKSLSLLLFFGLLIFAGFAKDKKAVLDENNLIQEEETPESVHSVNLSDGNWIMFFYSEQEAIYSWDEIVIISPNNNYNVWNFTIDGDSVTMASWTRPVVGNVTR